MNTQNKYNIYIGLLKADMITRLNKEDTIKAITKKLLNIGIIGLNIESIKGFWNGHPEEALKISFINTFDIEEFNLIRCLESLKTELEQESILLEVETVKYSFVGCD